MLQKTLQMDNIKSHPSFKKKIANTSTLDLTRAN